LPCRGLPRARRPLELDDFIGFPSRDYLVGTAVAGKDRIAWVEKQRGVVNLWAAEEEHDWTPRQLTNNTSDDGTDSFDFLQFTPDGSALVFVSRVAADDNPNHLVTPPVAATYMVPFGGGSVVRLAPRSASLLSRDGNGFLYTADGRRAGESTSVWQQELEGNGRAERLFSLKQGTVSDLTWQPGGGVLAFSNDRGDHGFVGLYAPGAAAIVWMPASVDTDLQPAWSTDGRRLAWLRARVPKGNVGYSPFDGNMGNRGPDFGVWVADVAAKGAGLPSVSGAREIFRDERYGMLNFGYGQRPLLWVNGDVVLFGTEAISSWGHAVMLDTQDRSAMPQELRPGQCEDISWLLGGDGWVYLVNNCLQIDGVGVERVRLSDREREVIAGGAHSFDVIGMSANGYGLALLSAHVAFLAATYKDPTGVRIVGSGGGGGGVRSVTKDSGFASSSFVEPRLVEFRSSDGRFNLHAQLFLPSGNSTAMGKIPGVVYTHGGSERQVYAAFHYSSVYAQEYAANQWLAQQGFAVLSVNYRSGTGYGHDFRVCDRCMARGAAEYQDVREGAIQLGSLEGVDEDRIGIWGLSYGGLNAEQACARDSGLFKACVALAGIFNWVSSERYGTDTGLSVYDVDPQPRFPSSFRSLPIGPEPAWAGPSWMDRVKRVQALMLESSPAGHVENLTSPMLLIHGDADEEVDFQESLGAVRAVRALGRDNVKAVVFPDESHGLSTYAHQLLELQAMGDFLLKHLKGRVATDVWI